jgi:hypothetical protein
MKKLHLYLGLVRMIVLLVTDIVRLVFWLHVIAGLAINYRIFRDRQISIPI